MSNLLSLPIELRFQIYRDLRSLSSVKLRCNGVVIGYCAFGFKPAILAASQQIHDEARQIFYNDNVWTFFASATYKATMPELSGFRSIQKAQIDFSMYTWLFMQAHDVPFNERFYGSSSNLRANLTTICKTLASAPMLRTVDIVWLENAPIMGHSFSNCFIGCHYPCNRQVESGKWRSHCWEQVSVMQQHISKILQPLCLLPSTCALRKAMILVTCNSGKRARMMEVAFENCLVAVIALRSSS